LDLFAAKRFSVVKFQEMIFLYKSSFNTKRYFIFFYIKKKFYLKEETKRTEENER